MASLDNISGKDAVETFLKDGWHPLGKVGNRMVMVKPEIKVNLSIPQQTKIPVRTLRALIQKSGLTVEEFLQLV